MDNIPEIDIYTDGACSGNPGPGGWGAVLIYNGIKKKYQDMKKIQLIIEWN
jgi:RNase H.